MKTSVFESDKPKPVEKKLSIPCPVDLLSDIREIKKQLKEHAPQMRFNEKAICVNALEKAVKQAHKELEQMDSYHGTSTTISTSETTSDGTFDGGGKSTSSSVTTSVSKGTSTKPTV